MMRKLASVQLIEEISVIPDADRIERLKVLGWFCVGKKGEFMVGDKVVFCEIDSLIPRTWWSEFLFKNTDKQNIRIKTERFRGQLSQGIVFPLSILSSGDWNIGDDVTDILNIVKFEPNIPAVIGGEAVGLRPSCVPKTDEFRIQSFPDVLDEIQGKQVYISTKMDGSSMSVYFFEGKFGVCSRNLELRETPKNSLWRIANENNLREKLQNKGEYVIQGELCGLGVNGNPMKYHKLTWMIFNVYDIRKGNYLDYLSFIDFCEELQLQTVPIEEITTAENWTMEFLLERSKGVYANTTHQKEGIVIRPLYKEYSATLGQRLSFKVINDKYL